MPVTVTVGSDVYSQLNPINFIKLVNGPNPLPQVLSVATTTPGTAFNAAVSTSTGGNWLAVTTCGSYCVTPEAITVTANPAVTLAAGT